MTLAINIVSLATYFPVMRPLQPIVRPIQRTFRRLGNKPYTKAVASVLGDAFERLYKSGSAAKLQSLVPYLLIVAEMLEERDAVVIMVDAISSSDDLWAWIEYLNLPVEGWEGEGDPPEVALTDPWSPTERESMVAAVLDALIPTAEAAPKLTRLRGGVLAQRLVQVFARELAGIDPKDLTRGIEQVLPALKRTTIADMRKVVSTEEFLAITGRLGRNSTKNLCNFVEGRTNSRIHPLLVLGIVAYLESQMVEGGPLDDDDIRRQVRLLYAKAMVDVAGDKVLDEESAEIDESSFGDGLAGSIATAAVLDPGAQGGLVPPGHDRLRDQGNASTAANIGLSRRCWYPVLHQQLAHIVVVPAGLEALVLDAHFGVLVVL